MQSKQVEEAHEVVLACFWRKEAEKPNKSDNKNSK